MMEEELIRIEDDTPACPRCGGPGSVEGIDCWCADDCHCCADCTSDCAMEE